MVDWAELAGAQKSASHLLVLYVPSADRDERPIDHEAWVQAALDFLAEHLGGATAFPQARGVWRDDQRGGKILHDRPTIIQCYTDEASLEDHFPALVGFLRRMGGETNQRAVGFVIDREYYEIQFD
jgi:hypothetical protein